MVRVFHCDDSPAYRALIRATLGTQEDIEIVGEAEDIDGVLAGVAQTSPDVVLLDLVDDSSGGELIRRLSPARVVVLSGHPREYGEGKRAGAVAYVEKSASFSELHDVVVQVARGG